MSKSKTESVEIMLKLKFGTIADAYKHWFNTPYDKKHGLTEDELHLIHEWERAMQNDSVSPLEMYNAER